MHSLQHPATVYIVEDDDDLRHWLTDVVDGLGHRFVLTSSTASLLQGDELSRPACVVFDIAAAAPDGMTFLERFVERHEVAPPAIVFSARTDAATVVQSMRNGAIDFLEKPATLEVMRESIRHAVEADMARMQRSKQLQELRSRIRSLSADERSVLDLLLVGRSNKEIAAHTGTSVRTVQFRRAAIMRKMDADCLAALARKVVHFELCSDPED